MKISTWISVLFLLLLIFIYSHLIIVPECENAEIVFVHNDTHINETISKEDTKKLRAIISKYNFLYYDNPSCGFDENISIRFGRQVFSPSCDSCPVIRHKFKYFDVSESDIEQFKKIMGKYGAYFPCV